MTSINPRIVFFQVADTASKLLRITETARLHFFQKEPFIFFVEDEKAEHFLDELLWKLPPSGFLPHTAPEETTGSAHPMVITRSKTNVNGALFAFNLCPTPLFVPGFKIIYELEDLTTPHKKNLSNTRFQSYKDAHFPIESK